MQVAGVNSSLPISTQIIKKAGQAVQAPETPASPEQVNQAVDRAADRVTETQASWEQSQTNRRTSAAQLYSANSQQNQLDIYLAVASEGEVDSTSGSTSTALQLKDNAGGNDLSHIADDNGRQRPIATPARPEEYIDTHA